MWVCIVILQQDFTLPFLFVSLLDSASISCQCFIVSVTLIVMPIGSQPISNIPCVSQQMVAICFPAEGAVPNFLYHGVLGCSHFIDCLIMASD